VVGVIRLGAAAASAASVTAPTSSLNIGDVLLLELAPPHRPDEIAGIIFAARAGTRRKAAISVIRSRIHFRVVRQDPGC
jgi:hypothetical protein